MRTRGRGRGVSASIQRARRWGFRGWRIAAIGALFVATLGVLGAPASALAGHAAEPRYAGITTIADPAANITPAETPEDFFSATYCAGGSTPDDSARCTDAALDAINSAHVQWGLAPISLPGDWGTLDQAQQLITVFNLERASYGLAPISGLGSSLDADAVGGAEAGADPALDPPDGFVNGGSIWAGGYPNALAADFGWMWDDGWGGSAGTTVNRNCTSATAAGCWGHRQIILSDCRAQGVGVCRYVAGAAETPFSAGGSSPITSFAAVVDSTTGSLPPLDYTYPDTLTVVTSSLPGGSPGISYSDSLAVLGGVPPYSWYLASGNLPSGLVLNRATGTISGTPTTLGTYPFYVTVTDSNLPSASVEEEFSITIAPYSPHGYWMVAGDGGVFTFGQARFFGSTGRLTLQRPVVGMTVTADRAGYWMVATDGGLFAFGDARYHGSLPGLGLSPAGSGLPRSLNAPIVAMVASPTGSGYLMVASDGGVFAFGDAHYRGSCPQIHGCSGPVVAVVPDAGERGYWIVTATGHVYAFGNAAYLGGQNLVSAPVTGATSSVSGVGYGIVDARGDVYGFGDFESLGDAPRAIPAAIEAIVPTSSGNGYWLFGAAGGVYPYGDAPDYGSMAGKPLNAPVVAAVGY